MLEIIGLLGGGLIRLAPNILSFFKSKQDSEFELRRMDKQIELEKAAADRAIAENQGKIAIAALDNVKAEIGAYSDAIRAQAQKSGIRIVDALNVLFRPYAGYILLTLYVAYKAIVIFTVFESQGVNMGSIGLVYDDFDRTTFSGVLSFFFVNRVIAKNEH